MQGSADERSILAADRAAEDQRLVTLEAELNRYKVLHKQNGIVISEQKRKLAEAAAREERLVKKVESLEQLKSGVAYRTGRIVVEAFSHPLTRLWRLPFSLLSLHWKNRREKKGAK
jgi:hypothetical protein